MFFQRKKQGKVCENCSGSVSKSYAFCPYCGMTMRNPAEELKDYGMLGREDTREEDLLKNSLAGIGITEKVLGSFMQNIMKNLETQFNNLDHTEVQNLPNGIKIKIGAPQKRTRHVQKQEVSTEQIERMSGLPRTTAKTNVRRMSDKVIYELAVPGVQSVQDIFISKLESGYEVKAIGKRKVYVNSLPVNLPLKKYSITDKQVIVEFGLQ